MGRRLGFEHWRTAVRARSLVVPGEPESRRTAPLHPPRRGRGAEILPWVDENEQILHLARHAAQFSKLRSVAGPRRTLPRPARAPVISSGPGAARQGLQHAFPGCQGSGGVRGASSTPLATPGFMERDRMRRTLKHLGIGASNYKVLKLLPLVYVAWASGTLTPERKERLVDLAHNHFQIGDDGEQILRHWLAQAPDKKYMMEGLHDILLLAYAPDEWEFDVDELPGLLAHAEAIARTTASAMDAPTSVSPAEEQALADIARELGVEEGESWAALVKEIGAAS